MKKSSTDKELLKSASSTPSKSGTPPSALSSKFSLRSGASASKDSLNDLKGDLKSSGSNLASSNTTLNGNNTLTSTANEYSSGNSTKGEGGMPSLMGTLVVTVMDGRGLDLPSQLTGAVSKGDARLPFVLVEFDNSETVTNAREWNQREEQIVWNSRHSFDVTREGSVAISVFQRSPDGDHRNRLVGHSRFRPSFKNQDLQEDVLQLYINPDDAPSNCTGALHIKTSYKRTQADQSRLNIEDFDLLKVIGKGSFGKVMQVRKKDSNRIYAMKIIKKSYIVQREEVSHTLAERMVLARINHPFIVPLKFSFQSPEKLYLVLAFVNGGELFHHLQQETKFSEDRARFYAAELLCALECLHHFDIVYRDLKPENILLDYSGHIALCDFGLCKLNMTDGNKTNTFCGTPEYLSPEVLIGKGYSKAVDWWTLGILLYEMLSGLPPFYDEDVNEMYKKILKQELKFTDDFGSAAQDLLRQLLNRDPNQRLGSGSAEDIKRHPFFANINWQKLMARKYNPPFRPNVSSATDTSNFDEEFTSEAPQDSLPDQGQLSEAEQEQFEGFSYRNDNQMAGSVAGSLMGANARMGASVAGSFRGAGSLRR
ncbi:hypothetical protein HK101_007181 [Irineochytrium annulatum]|nr:hypothetical protein HK101_007181 [Irineochytrium annulatum]